MPTLNWIGKDKVVNHHLDVPFRTLEKQYTFAPNGEDDDGEVYIYRFQEVNGEPSLDNIMDDDEYERVADAFDELLDDSEYDELVDADDEN